MTQYNPLHTKLSNSQLSKLKSAITNENEVVIRLSPNMIGDSNDQTNFPYELLLTDRQVSSIRKAFANNSSVDIKFSKTQSSKMIQSRGFLGKLLGPLLKTEKTLRSGGHTTLIISNNEIEDLKSLKDSGLLLKGVTKSIQNEVKEQRGGFLSMLLGTLGASLLGILLADKGIHRADEGIVRAGEGSMDI